MTLDLSLRFRVELLKEMLTVGQLAKACDVRADTVRYYERIGMIDEACRSDSGYRKFADETANRIRFIKNAQSLGFTLDEIRRLIELADLESSDCSEVRQFAETKITAIEEQIRQLRALKQELKKLVTSCPGEGVPIDGCNILARMTSNLEPTNP